MKSDLKEHYEAVLDSERAERDRLRVEIGRLSQILQRKESVIAALSTTLSLEDGATRALTSPLPFTQPVGLAVPQPHGEPRSPFDGISVRWAILRFLSDFVPESETRSTTEMAEALASGGVRSGSQNFAANVSAIVSDMVHKRKELEPVDGKYRITQKGRETWQTIMSSRRYRSRVGSF